MLGFNHDGFGLLSEVAALGGGVDAVEEVLIRPLAGTAISVLDWCICSTGIQNCRTRRGQLVTRPLLEATQAGHNCWGAEAPAVFPIGDIVTRYATQAEDLLDLVIRLSRPHGLRVFGNVRLNHAASPLWLTTVPGPRHAAGMRIDFRDPEFQDYLISLFEDLLAKGVAGLSLDFERKAPFFPEGTPPAERLAAGLGFLRRVRRLTDKPLLVRVSQDPAQGEPQGQAAAQWLAEGLVDILVPATHNHEPDHLNWGVERWLTAAARSPRPCLVWPQIWPTPVHWGEREGHWHTPAAVAERVRALLAAGADGAYFFNFCCQAHPSPFYPMFRELGRD